MMTDIQETLMIQAAQKMEEQAEQIERLKRVLKRLCKATDKLADEAFANMIGGRCHLIDKARHLASEAREVMKS